MSPPQLNLLILGVCIVILGAILARFYRPGRVSGLILLGGGTIMIIGSFFVSQ